MVVVLFLAAHVDHAVDGARSAENFAAWNIEGGRRASHVALTSNANWPLGRRIERRKRLGSYSRSTRPSRLLQAENAMLAVLTETRGDATRRAGADDDVIELF